ncbi:MAG: hypothetical protein FWG10_00995 [Eubacteriaceae bacterium]|nr:hypothetical protein [Eubacteriaceae bacterium]
MVAVPADLPITTPPLLTVTTAVLLELQDTTFSVAFDGDTPADSSLYVPLGRITVAGETVTLATGTLELETVTLTVQVSLRPFDVLAVMTTLPAALPVTTPLLLTVATLVSLELHVTALSVAFDGDTVAVSVVCAPILIVGVGVFGLHLEPADTSTSKMTAKQEHPLFLS